MKKTILTLIIISSSVIAGGITDLWLQQGYDGSNAAGEQYISNTDSRYYSIFREDFYYATSLEEDTSENLWWTTFMVGFDEWTPATTLYDTWTEECPGEDDWGCSNNGEIHENLDETWDIESYVDDHNGYVLDTTHLMKYDGVYGELGILAIHYVPDGEDGNSTLLHFVVKNEGTSTLTGGYAGLVSDLDAGGAWWPDPEFLEWEDGWDALEWNNSGIDTVNKMVYQYFHPAMLDTNGDGTHEYPNADPYMYVGMAGIPESFVTDEGDSPEVAYGVGDNWLDIAVDESIFLEIVDGDYEYDGYYEEDSTMDDLWSYVAFGLPDLAPGEETDVVFVMVAAETEAELTEAAAEAVSVWTSGSTTGIDNNNADVPLGFSLHQNHPNPFNPSTTITFDVTQNEEISLDIFDLRGNHIVNLANNTGYIGKHTVRWQGVRSSGETVPTGVYLYRLSAGENSQTRKMLFIK